MSPALQAITLSNSANDSQHPPCVARHCKCIVELLSLSGTLIKLTFVTRISDVDEFFMAFVNFSLCTVDLDD